MKRERDHSAALAAAVAGKTGDLFRQLELGSGLPGPRMNQKLALDFAQDCASLGAKGDALAYGMAALPPEGQRGAAANEFLSACGVLAVAARAMNAKEHIVRMKALALLEVHADDTRFRVRDSVPLALAMLGSKMKGDLPALVEPWLDRYFHAAAVLRALADPQWLETFAVDHHDVPINALDAAFRLVEAAPRSAARYPGYKALVEVLAWAPKKLAKRFGLPMFERLGTWAETVKLPELREAILANLDDPSFKKGFAQEIRRVEDRVEGSKKPPRDPTKLIAGMRGRGKKRR